MLSDLKLQLVSNYKDDLESKYNIPFVIKHEIGDTFIVSNDRYNIWYRVKSEIEYKYGKKFNINPYINIKACLRVINSIWTWEGLPKLKIVDIKENISINQVFNNKNLIDICKNGKYIIFKQIHCDIFTLCKVVEDITLRGSVDENDIGLAWCYTIDEFNQTKYVMKIPVGDNYIDYHIYR